jgi:aspartate ammonia-lyase
MEVKRPKFLDSPFFINNPGKWRLKDGAPKKVVDEFKSFKKLMNQNKHNIK